MSRRTTSQMTVETALLFMCLALAAYGLVRRFRRLRRLNHLRLPKPEQQEDVDYLQSVKRSTYLRLISKTLLATGVFATLIGMPLSVLEMCLVGTLVSMDIETVSVDKIRQRLASNAISRRRSQR